MLPMEEEGRRHPSDGVGEESPDSAGQGVPWLTREGHCHTDADGKCHRKKPPPASGLAVRVKRWCKRPPGLGRKPRRQVNPARSKIE